MYLKCNILKAAAIGAFVYILRNIHNYGQATPSECDVFFSFFRFSLKWVQNSIENWLFPGVAGTIISCWG